MERSPLDSYLLYKIPKPKIFHYVFCLWLVTMIIPTYFLNVKFTTLQHFLNFLWYDFLYWVMLKIEANFKKNKDEDED